ncbi:MAG: DUF4920 domain-containing protein [Pseudomonadota bacterium]
MNRINWTKTLVNFSLCLLFPLAANAALDQAPIRLSEPVEADEYSETFGARFQVKGETLGLMGLKQAVQKNQCELDTPVTLKTTVSQVCQKKGCFFIAQEEEFYTRVTFRDYGFFVPTDIAGREVVINATLTPRELTANEVAHFNQDLGKTDSSIAAGKVCELTADSVRVFLAPNK